MFWGVVLVFSAMRLRIRQIAKGLTPLEAVPLSGTRLLTGFTLVEMLVVVGIVALLAFVVTVAIFSARQRSRDARRIADINQVRIALEQYFKGKKNYPDPSPQRYCGLEIPLAAYLSVLPRDPQDTGVSCSVSSRYEYYTESTLQPKQWLLRAALFELPTSLKAGFSDDADGNIGPQGGGGWFGGTASATCSSCPTLDCGTASNDTIYCIRS